VFKAKLIVVLADGKSYSSVETELGRSRPAIARWKTRFEEARIAGLSGRHKGACLAKQRRPCRRGC
jgi:transposase